MRSPTTVPSLEIPYRGVTFQTTPGMTAGPTLAGVMRALAGRKFARTPDGDYFEVLVEAGDLRVSALAAGGEILTTRTVKDLVAGSGIEFGDLGLKSLKGIAEPWQIYRVL